MWTKGSVIKGTKGFLIKSLKFALIKDPKGSLIKDPKGALIKVPKGLHKISEPFILEFFELYRNLLMQYLMMYFDSALLFCCNLDDAIFLKPSH